MIRENVTILARKHDVLLKMNEEDDAWIRSKTINKWSSACCIIWLGWRGLDDDYSKTEAVKNILFGFVI